MALGLQNYNGGTTDEYGTNLVLDRFIGSGVVEGLLVQANASPNMTVYVQPGTVTIATGTYPSSYNYRAHIDTALPGAGVTIGTAAASPRIDYIVAYTDKSVAGSTAGANVNNTNAVLKLADVQGTPAGSPSVPTVAQIQATIGASNPYFILAQIAVGASVSTITNSNITDLRTFISPANSKALGASSYVDNGGIMTFTGGTLNGGFTAGLVYINVSAVMVPQSFNLLTFTVTASKDTYFYVTLGNSTIQSTNVTNGAAAPALPTNSVWLGIAISGASAITSIVQKAASNIGALIYPSGASSSKSTQIPYKFAAYNSATQAVNAGNTKVTLNTKQYDTGNNFDAATNYRFTAPVAGFYSFNGGVNTSPYTNSTNYAMIYKNGTEVRRGASLVSGTTSGNWQSTVRIDNLPMLTGDYVELWFYESGGSGQTLNNGFYCTYLEGYLAGTA